MEDSGRGTHGKEKGDDGAKAVCHKSGGEKNEEYADDQTNESDFWKEVAGQPLTKTQIELQKVLSCVPSGFHRLSAR